MKAVFVDGSSFHFMMLSLGVKRTKFQALFDHLKNNVGHERDLVAPPILTLSVNALLFGIGSAATKAGFNVIPHTPGSQDDDRAILEGIRSVDSAKTKEIVVVSADQDFARQLFTQSERGIQIYVVATMVGKSNDGPFMAATYNTFFQNAGFKFVELADIKDRIMLEERKTKSLPPPTHRYLINLRTQDESMPREVKKALKDMRKRFPGLTFKRIKR